MCDWIIQYLMDLILLRSLTLEEEGGIVVELYKLNSWRWVRKSRLQSIKLTRLSCRIVASFLLRLVVVREFRWV